MRRRAPQLFHFIRATLFVAVGWVAIDGSSFAAQRPPVHPRRNIDEFAPVRARFLRFTIKNASGTEPCIDEIEVYGGRSDRNLALASYGTKVTGCGSLPGYKIHRIENINDGLYGNGQSWISNLPRKGWVMLQFPEPVTIDRVVWGRDREGKFIDRLTTEYVVEVSDESNGPWVEVASSADREPLKTGAEFQGENPAVRQSITRFAPVGTSLPPYTRPSSREFIIDTWQSENGLPSNTISSILQTRDGYLWIGTFHGLVRFDGVRFRGFREVDGLANHPITCLYESTGGDLWIGTEGAGLIRHRQGEFQVWTKDDGLPQNSVLALEVDAAGELWIGTSGGLCSWSADGLKTYAAARMPILRLRHDERGNLWAIAGGTLQLIKNGTPVAPSIQEEPARFSSLFTLSRGRNNDLWFGGANAYVARWNGTELSLFGKDSGLVPDDVWDVCAASTGDVWIATASGGVSRLREGRFTTITTQEGLSSNSIRTLFEDREGNMWIGSNGGGLMRLKPRKLATFSTRDGLSHEVIMSLAEEPDGQLWIGSNCGGLNILRGDEGTPASLSYLLDNSCIWSLLRSREGTLWIGTWGQGLFAKQGESLTNYSGLSDNVILALHEDRSGGLWIGTYQGGLNYLRNGQVQRFTTSDGLPANFITCITETRDGTFWIGTSGGGLSRYDRGRFHTFNRSDGLGSNFIRTLHEDAKGVLWVGTSGGLARLNQGQWRTATLQHGLPDEMISQLLEDDFGNFWIGSNQGIFVLARKHIEELFAGERSRLEPVCYGKGEGMESLECTGGFSPSGLRTRDGKLWFSTVKGLVRADPSTLNERDAVPSVVLEDVLVDGVALDTRGGAARVKAGGGRFEFHYTALSLAAPERVRFKYRLEGLEESWTDAGNSRAAQYSALPPGDYTFRVAARSPEGVWNDEGAVLGLTVLRRFWQTSWFAAAMVACSLATVAIAVRYVSVRKWRSRLERLEQQHALERERARIAQDIHDDIGTTLTQIAYLSDFGQRKAAASPEAHAQFQQISRTAREVVRALDQIVWAVNPRNDSLEHLANYLSQFVQEFLASTSIRCRLELPDQLPEIHLATDERHNLLLAVKEAVHNAVKHSQANEVLFRLSVAPGEFAIEIQDDGIGFAPGHSGAPGDGLTNMHNRLKELGGDVTITTREGQGTVVRFQLKSLGGRLSRAKNQGVTTLA